MLLDSWYLQRVLIESNAMIFAFFLGRCPDNAKADQNAQRAANGSGAGAIEEPLSRELQQGLSSALPVWCHCSVLLLLNMKNDNHCLRTLVFAPTPLLSCTFTRVRRVRFSRGKYTPLKEDNVGEVYSPHSRYVTPVLRRRCLWFHSPER